MALKTYRELDAWKRAMDLVVDVYKLSHELPNEERFGLISQMQRAAVSVPANVAEGYGRKHRGDYLHHLSIARGSLAELETHITLAVRLEYVGRDRVLELWNLCQEVGRILNKLMRALESRGSLNPEPGTRNPSDTEAN